MFFFLRGLFENHVLVVSKQALNKKIGGFPSPFFPPTKVDSLTPEKWLKFIWVFPKIGVFPRNHPIFHKVFHYFHHPFWGKHPPFSETSISQIWVWCKLNCERSWLFQSPQADLVVEQWDGWANQVTRAWLCFFDNVRNTFNMKYIYIMMRSTMKYTTPMLDKHHLFSFLLNVIFDSFGKWFIYWPTNWNTLTPPSEAKSFYDGLFQSTKKQDISEPWSHHWK